MVQHRSQMNRFSIRYVLPSSEHFEKMKAKQRVGLFGPCKLLAMVLGNVRKAAKVEWPSVALARPWWPFPGTLFSLF